jgi:uncharacterized membrane protein
LVIQRAIWQIQVCPGPAYNTFEGTLEKKLFWIIFLGLSLLADVFLPFFWGMVATLPLVVLSWWLVYRSGWLC